MNKISQLFRQVKDKRALQGRRYPLFAILNLVLLSKLCGCQTLKEAFVLSRDLHPKQWFSLGFRRHTRISYSALLETLQQVDVESLERAISSHHLPEKQLAVDGKSLAGRRTEAGDAYHLVSLFGASLHSIVIPLKNVI